MKTILTIVVAGVLLAGHAHAQPQLLQLSQEQQAQVEFSRDLDANSFYFGLAIQQINTTWSKQWSKPTAELEAFLNGLGAQKLTNFIALQAATATAVNGLLDATQSTLPRVNATPGRQLMVDQSTGYITVVPLPEEMVDLGEAPNPEPTPEPSPTPEPESAFVVEDAPLLSSSEAARPRFVKAVLSWRE